MTMAQLYNKILYSLNAIDAHPSKGLDIYAMSVLLSPTNIAKLELHPYQKRMQ